MSPLKRALKHAGLRSIGWHVLRHTFASHLVMRGVALKVVQELLGQLDRNHDDLRAPDAPDRARCGANLGPSAAHGRTERGAHVGAKFTAQFRVPLDDPRRGGEELSDFDRGRCNELRSLGRCPAGHRTADPGCEWRSYPPCARCPPGSRRRRRAARARPTRLSVPCTTPSGPASADPLRPVARRRAASGSSRSCRPPVPCGARRCRESRGLRCRWWRGRPSTGRSRASSRSRRRSWRRSERRSPRRRAAACARAALRAAAVAARHRTRHRGRGRARRC
jgi:Phage integrase family